MPASALLVTLLAAAPPAGDAVEACRRLHAGNPSAHIACLESALRGGGVSAAAPPPAASVSAPVTVAAPAGAAAATGIGAEQIEQRRRIEADSEERESVRIASVRYDARGRGQFAMESGQVWRETEVTPAHLRLDPGREYSGRIERGAMGGYRLYVDGEKRMLKVERLQ